MTQHPDSTEAGLDSSHSGIVAGLECWRRVGLDGAEAAKSGCWKERNGILERDSQTGLGGFEPRVGEERGGVTGALFDIRRGGRVEGMEAKLWRKGRMCDGGFPSQWEGLGNEDDVGLAW